MCGGFIDMVSDEGKIRGLCVVMLSLNSSILKVIVGQTEISFGEFKDNTPIMVTSNNTHYHK